MICDSLAPFLAKLFLHVPGIPVVKDREDDEVWFIQVFFFFYKKKRIKETENEAVYIL